MAPGANVPTKSGTGTVPKSKSRNTPIHYLSPVVRREMVAPTRRDIQMNMNSAESYDWRPESENGGNVPINSSNYSSLLDFYSDLDSTVSHDNNRFVPVRPQPRSLGLSQQEDENLYNNGFHSNSPSNMSAANTAIVMPTTPGTSRNREPTPSYRRADRTCVVLNPVSQNNPQNDSVNVSSQTVQSISGAADGSSGSNNVKTSNVPTQMPDRQVLEQKLQQIREYLKITTSMIQSVGDENQVVTDEDVDMLRLINELKDSEAKLVKQLSEYDNIDESHVENINKNEAHLPIASNQWASDEMQRFTHLLNIFVNQVEDKYSNMSNTNYGAADVERASSSLSQTSQSSYNTLSTKLQPQQTINQVGPSDAERTKIDCKNKQIRNSNNIVASSNRSSQDSGTALHPVNNDDQRNVASNSGPSNEGVDGDAKRFDLTGQKLQQDLKVLLENLKGSHSVNNENNIDLSNQDSTSDENAKVRRLEATVSQLQERLRHLRTVSEEQNANDVYIQLENIKNLNERIAKLRQRTEEREEINRILGERDEQLSAEHRALQDKLRDLHHKKEQVEKLVNDLQNLARAPPLQDQSLASMRSQLASFQAMLDSVTRTETELNHNASVQQSDSQSVSSANCLINKYENINGDRTKNRNVYHPIDFPIENRDSLDEEEDVARGGGRFDKKVNKNTAIVGSFERQQMILTAELQAKKRELEELMRKDQGCSSSVNQDTCNTSTIDKSEIPRFPQEENFLSGGRSSLDNHSDNDYTSDDEVGENNASLRYSSSVNVSNNQLNNHIVPPSNNSNVSNHLLNVNKTRSKVRASPNLSNREITTDMSACSTPEPLPNTVWRKTSQTSHHSQVHLNNTKKSQEQSSITNHDAASMSICSGMESMPPPMTPLWRKTSQGSMWNASPWYYGNSGTQRAEVGNVANLDTAGNNTSSSGRQQPTQGTKEWWQKKALQLQQQLELTSNLCQSILVDQQVASSQSPSSSINNEPAYLSYPPVPFNASQFMPLRSSGTGQSINSADVQCQNLVAASQFHFQSMLMTSLNHCYQLIWMQQKELSLLRNMVTTLQESIVGNGERLIANSCSNLSNSQSQNMSNLRSNLQNQKPCVQNPSIPSQNNENLTNHQNCPQNVNSINNLSNLQTSNSLNAQNCFQNVQQFQNNTNLQQQNIPNQNLNFNTQNFQNNVVPVQNVPCISPNFNNQSIANNLMPLQFQSDTAVQRPQCVQNVQAAPTTQNISWNGVQALNNQVPPGNRANNYWDNFRSYSRQNLLSTTSTKSNEGSSHSPSPLIDRAHNNMFRTNGFLGPVESLQLNHATLPKLNTNTVQDDAKVTRQKKSQIRQSSDVSINVNQNNETGQFHLNNQNLSADMPSEQTTAATIHNHLLNIIQQNLNSESDGAVSTNTPSNLEQRSNGTDISNVRAVIDSVEPSFSNSESTKCLKQQSSQRNIYDPNEWRENAQNDSRNERPKTKLFDILRDNVYKEVASLISANENRPHFLIQLFRDLQLISSDGLRHRTLQSIQGVVTDSLANLPDNGQGASRQNLTASTKKENSQSSEIVNDEIKSNYNTESANTTTTTNQPDLSETAKLERDIHAVIYNLVPFFHVNADNICSDLMTETIRTLALQMIPTITFSDNPDKIKYYFSYCHSQLNSNLENALTKYHGCRLRDVTEDILSVITEVVINELSYVFGNETRDFNTEMSNESTEQSQSYEPSPESQASSDNHVEQECNSQAEERSVVIDCQPSLHNGDLAEADQSHENEEEGAVGGILNPDDGIALIKSEDVSSEDTGGNTEADSEWITFETGLDCIPSRLADANTNTENTNTSDKPPGQPYD